MTQTVSRMDMRVTQVQAREVSAGDVVLLDGELVKVHQVEVFDLAYHEKEPIQTSNGDWGHRWVVLKFSAATNFVRFPHEKVTVLQVQVLE